MQLLTKEQILSAADMTFEVVECPEWGGSVRVRSLTGAERDDFEGGSVKQKGKKYEANLANLRARLVALTAVDGDGQPMFSAEDVSKLGKKNAAALDRVFQVARKLSGLTPEDIEELSGNSDSQEAGAVSISG